MAIISQPYTILLLSTAIIASALVIAVLKNRPTLGTHSFAVMMAAVSMWAFMIIFEVIANDPPIKNFSGNFKYLFIVAVPVAWFTFGLYYSNRVQQLGWKRLVLLSIIPAITLLMVATNSFHHLMFASIAWHPIKGIILPSRVYGPWFWVHTTYSYGLIFLGFLFLAKSVIDSHRIFRSQGILLFIGALAPWLCNVFFLVGTRPLPFLDLTPFAFTISGLAVMWGIMRYRFLDIVPIAHDIIIRSMDDGIIVLDNRCRIMEVNSVAAAVLGKAPGDLVGRDAGQMIDWWPRPAITEDAMDMRAPSIIEIAQASRTRYLQISVSMIVNSGKSSGQLVILRDITGMKSTQDALRRSEGRFKSLSENAPVIILSLDESGIISYVNPAWKAILGHDREEVVGRPLDRFLAQESHAACAGVFDRLMKGEEVVAESNVQFFSEAGERRIFDFTASVNSDDEGRITGIVCLAKDVTEEHRLQEQLFQSQKMEAIGTLAGGIAHDFNNLLMGMQANVSLIRMETEPVQPIMEKLKRIEDQIQCGASLTRQLLGYARKGKYVLAATNIHQLIEETLQVVQRTNKNIAMQHRLDADPSYMDADKGQMEMVLLNLYVNAVDAMSTGGRLFITTRIADLTTVEPQWPSLKPGRYIEIRVSDTGVGMDRKTMARIFEPFFTTKEIGRGTGLGLASVYGVVKNHHGDIRVHSVLGQGTTFVLMFPAAVMLKQQQTAPAAAVISFPRGRKILLVDDELPVLEFVGEMIESLGFVVFRAGDGKAALRRYKENHADIDLVVLDMVMPDMDGKKVLQSLQTIDPGVKVIFISGYGKSASVLQISQAGPHAVLTKPFTREQLAEAIGNALAPCDVGACARCISVE